MRTFDYRNLPRKLFGGAVGDANVRVYEDRGRLDALRTAHADILASLEAEAHFDNVDASTRIEGLYVGADRTRELLAGAEAHDETEAQVIGYSNALRLIEERADELDVSTASVLAFYETLYGYRDLGRKSRYRKKDYLYVQVDGHMQAMPVSPITAFETPLVFGGACDSLAEAFAAKAASPLILNAVFAVDLLCIRPFEEGNGRISRLFAQLLLEKSGFDIARYVSVDRIIEKTAMGYYDALNACVEGWDRGRNDYEPYVLFWLDVVHAAYQQLFEAIESADAMRGLGKSERVRQFVKSAPEPVAKRQILSALPDVSEATVENALGAMVRAGEVEKMGAGRSTTYAWRN